MKNSDKKSFSFLKNFFILALVLSIGLILVFLGISDGGVGDIGDIVLSSIIFSLLLSGIVTYIHKWIFESRNLQQAIETDNAGNTQVKKQWDNFSQLFWLLFVFKLISKGAETVQDEFIVLVLFSLEFIAIIGMVILMGYYGYKFSGKRLGWFYGIFGILWFGIIGIFVGYSLIRWLRNKRLGIKEKSFHLYK